MLWTRARAKRKDKGKKADKGKGKEKGKQPARSPRKKADENPDKDGQCINCRKKEHRKRACRKRIRDQGIGQKTLAEDETPPSCEAYEEQENDWILMLGLDSLQSDSNVEGSRLLICKVAALSACPPQLCAGTIAANGATIQIYGENTIRLLRQTPSIDVNFQVADVHTPIIAVRDLTARGCEVELSKNGACILTGARRWKLEQGPGQSFLTAESLRDVSNTLLYDEITPLEVSLIPVSETEVLLPAEQDKKKHEPFDVPIEIRAPQVKRGPSDPTDDDVTKHEPLHLSFRKLVSHLHRSVWNR